ncbi:PREDICTED: proline-rich receptor-like protein kinase PERK2, partial [Dipodomys ordii]|uniref:Proline-rich receptor-like protein kinase PERK2 n=1 Tax=Dipodomys ordii TaxID=10020 RepID=A0A1S3FRK5_DIPOR
SPSPSPSSSPSSSSSSPSSSSLPSPSSSSLSSSPSSSSLPSPSSSSPSSSSLLSPSSPSPSSSSLPSPSSSSLSSSPSSSLSLSSPSLSSSSPSPSPERRPGRARVPAGSLPPQHADSGRPRVGWQQKPFSSALPSAPCRRERRALRGPAKSSVETPGQARPACGIGGGPRLGLRVASVGAPGSACVWHRWGPPARPACGICGGPRLGLRVASVGAPGSCGIGGGPRLGLRVASVGAPGSACVWHRWGPPARPACGIGGGPQHLSVSLRSDHQLRSQAAASCPPRDPVLGSRGHSLSMPLATSAGRSLHLRWWSQASALATSWSHVDPGCLRDALALELSPGDRCWPQDPCTKERQMTAIINDQSGHRLSKEQRCGFQLQTLSATTHPSCQHGSGEQAVPRDPVCKVGAGTVSPHIVTRGSKKQKPPEPSQALPEGLDTVHHGPSSPRPSCFRKLPHFQLLL